MRALKINWLFKNEVGFYLIVALLLMTISFLFFVCESIVQRMVAFLFLGYFSALLVKKYKISIKIAVLLTALLLITALINKEKKDIKLDTTSQIKIYPDQVRIKDNYLTGTGYVKDQAVLLNGRVSKTQ